VLLHGEPRLTGDVGNTLGLDLVRLTDLLSAAREMTLQVLVEDVEHFVGETWVLPTFFWVLGKICLKGGDGMPSFAGHPPVDVGLATITAFAGKTRPEDLSEKDYDAIADYIVQN